MKEERIMVLFFETSADGKIKEKPIVRGADVIWDNDPVLGKKLISAGVYDVELIYDYYQHTTNDGKIVNILPLWDGYDYNHHCFE